MFWFALFVGIAFMVLTKAAEKLQGVKFPRFTPFSQNKAVTRVLTLETDKKINALLLSEPHFLIGGTTGSGKSCLLNYLLFSIFGGGFVRSAVLIDLKRVELDFWRNVHGVTFADTSQAALKALESVTAYIDREYCLLQKQGKRKSDKGLLLVVIDELADLMLSDERKQIERLLQRIAQVGRAANVKLLVSTQVIRADILPLKITANITGRIALRCRTPLESRQVLSVPGAELLPKHGNFLTLTSDGLQKWTFRPLDDQKLKNQISKLS